MAETVRAAADGPVLDAADIELGNYHIAVYQHGLKTEMQGGGRMVVASARRAAPYLLRQSRWHEAGSCWNGCSSGTRVRPRWPLPCRCCGGSPKPPRGRIAG